MATPGQNEEVDLQNREENLAKISRRVKEYKINILNEPRPNKVNKMNNFTTVKLSNFGSNLTELNRTKWILSRRSVPKLFEFYDYFCKKFK
jgi:hypothetical protein